ncbi:alpha-amylase family glycosyl hydrolase [Labilibacter marinus]|uniref:alpha-amylase family glycosyl hydrolase n=1 Tax=Labilibacter marinus TaxID=1477105 RepID=UPI0009FA3B1C|nr:alpha-amylase family glycosyl hydrolase [Labilibacter marinus]
MNTNLNPIKAILIILFLALLNSCHLSENKKVNTGQFSWKNATVYFVYIDRFLNGDTSNDSNYGRINDYGTPTKNVATFHGGDLAGLTQKLQEGYFEQLGINVIWITGVYEQIHGWVGGGSTNDFPHYAYHGYYPFDFTQMDKNFGTINEMRAFVDLAHAKDIRIMMDAGINHPGYHTLLDAVQYNFGGVKISEEEAAAHTSGLNNNTDKAHYNAYEYLSHFEDRDSSSWNKWWGNNWIRSKHEVDQNLLTESIFGLPDYRTESSTNVSLPPVMKNKWKTDGGYYNAWVNPSAIKYRKNLQAPVSEHLTNWLASWVEEFGIDGFRCDVLENVDDDSWELLHKKCNEALVKWRSNHPEHICTQWADDFWMTGDIWGADYSYHEKYAELGFKSIVNFTFPKKYKLDSIGEVWQDYSDCFSKQKGWNTLSFLNNTYKRDTKPNEMLNNGTALLLSPGAVQIFYGDEVAREEVLNKASDPTHGYRGDYDWNNTNTAVLKHWQTIGHYRKKHIAVGAGYQSQLSSLTYGRTYTGENTIDKIIIGLSENPRQTFDIADFFSEGTKLRNYYTQEISIVKDSEVTFEVKNGVVLMELAD